MLKVGAVMCALAVIATGCSAAEEPVAAPTTTTVRPVAATEPSSTTTSTAPSVTTSAAPSSTTAAPTTTTMPITELQLQLVEVASGFAQPVLAVAPPDDTRLFIVDQPGEIYVLDGESVELFVDLTDDVVFGGERGLLGLAFHPEFAANGRFFVNYSGTNGATKIVELTADPGLDTASAASQAVLLEISQPARNHNGGMIAFGPDGALWIATGDGGASNDRFGHGQRPDTLLAALLRLDVAAPGAAAIPSDNPFVDGGGAAEVWSFGLRNPWRFTFDEGRIFIADVGQGRREEVNVLDIEASRGANFGWPIFEGTRCFAGPCDTPGLVDPAIEYDHGEGCSITGGFVYRGTLVPELDGHYFYSDFCGGWIRSRGPDGGDFEWFGDGAGGRVTSFGQDDAGEVYVMGTAGIIWRLERA